MADAPEFDIAAAHAYFAAHCFNQAWDLIDKDARTPQDELLMVALNQASIYHWLERDDCDDRRLSVGFWQAARIQAVLGNASEARRHAETCLSFSDGLPPFYLGYAYEALARAAALAGDREAVAAHLARAKGLAAQVADKDEREALLGDLADL